MPQPERDDINDQTYEYQFVEEGNVLAILLDGWAIRRPIRRSPVANRELHHHPGHDRREAADR